MTNPTTLTSRRTRLIGVLLILAVGTAAMLALIATERVSAQAQQAATPQQVATEFDPPVLSGVAHSDGAHLSWTFDATATTPPGWQLTGFELRRWVANTSGSLVALSSTIATADRAYHDTLTIATADRAYHDTLSNATDSQLYAGFQFSYSISALYERESDGKAQAGKDSSTLMFTVPSLPAVSDVSNNIFPTVIYGEDYIVNEISWSLPHLAWDTSTGFNQIDRVHLWARTYSVDIAGNRTWTQMTGRAETTEGECDFTFTIRLRYGIFFGAAATVDGTMC